MVIKALKKKNTQDISSIGRALVLNADEFYFTVFA